MINKEAYETLRAQDLAWLAQFPESPERSHIQLVLQAFGETVGTLKELQQESQAIRRKLRVLTLKSKALDRRLAAGPGILDKSQLDLDQLPSDLDEQLTKAERAADGWPPHVPENLEEDLSEAERLAGLAEQAGVDVLDGAKPKTPKLRPLSLECRSGSLSIYRIVELVELVAARSNGFCATINLTAEEAWKAGTALRAYAHCINPDTIPTTFGDEGDDFDFLDAPQPGDTEALMKLRSCLDDHGIWPSPQLEEHGDYEACVRHMAASYVTFQRRIDTLRNALYAIRAKLSDRNLFRYTPYRSLVRMVDEALRS